MLRKIVSIRLSVSLVVLTLFTVAVVNIAVQAQRKDVSKPNAPINPNDPLIQNSANKIAEGRQTFRFDTFGDEAFWGSTLHLHQAVSQLSPMAALGLGLKVDIDALP